MTNDSIKCGQSKKQALESDIKCNNIAEAVDYLYEHLPHQLSAAQRCQRYAVMLSFIKPKGRLHNKAVASVLEMSDYEVDRQYQALETSGEPGARFMTAIDGYRAASRLGPAIFELVECLKRVKSSMVEEYLSSAELNLILDWYKKVIYSPGTKLSLDRTQLSEGFSYSFIMSLMNLFKDYIRDVPPSVSQTSTEAGSAQQPMQSQNGAAPLRKRKETDRVMVTHRRRERERLRKKRAKLLNLTSRRQLEQEPQHTSVSRTSMQYKALQQQTPISDEIEQEVPDLAQLWSDVAPIFDSIATPTSPSSSEQPTILPSALSDQASQCQSDHQLAGRKDNIPDQRFPHYTSASHQPSLQRQGSLFKQSTSAPSASEVTGISEDSMSNLPYDDEYSVDSMIDNYLIDYRVRHGSHILSDHTIPIADPIYRFDDTDSVIESVLDISPQTAADQETGRLHVADPKNPKYDSQ